MSDSIRKLADSRYASRLLEAHPELRGNFPCQDLSHARKWPRALEGAAADDEAAADAPPAPLRSRVLLRVMARDLCGLADLDEVCGTMSELAELSIAAALQEKALIVVAMGKLGGRELNVSSDIDLVFVHAGGLDEQERWERAGRRLIRLLAPRPRTVSRSASTCACDRTATRARSPAASISSRPISSPRAANGSAMPGSRRARSLADNRRSLQAGAPFVYRKYLDYATLAAMRQLHAEVGARWRAASSPST
jgi:glutamate-ammonia-ligase adenylyltransferase